MTGFARREGGDGQVNWVWEIKSVNGRSLDMRLRLPTGYETLEAKVREGTRGSLVRGNLQINLTIDHSQMAPSLRVNQALLEQLLEQVKFLGDHVDASPPRLDGLLAIRGVVETMEPEELPEDRKARELALLADFDSLLSDLGAARRAEGARLEAIARDHLLQIEALVAEATQCAAAQPDMLRQRLAAQLAELLESDPPVPEERLAQELAIIAAKGDIREELDRLEAHVSAARELLDDGGAIGRRLDFLCQEFNREANTLCSKSTDLALTRIGLALKTAIEQLREQVQNIE